MVGALPRRLLARVVAGFFVLAGTLSLAGSSFEGSAIEILVATRPSWLAILLGALAFFLPWNRWPQAALWSLVLATMGLKAIGQAPGSVSSPYLYALHFVMIFMWIGVALPRWSAVACAPLLALVYVLPLYLAGAPRADLMTVVMAVPACVFVGEVAAWMANRLLTAEQRSQNRAVKMAGLVDATLALATCQQTEELARVTALGAVDLYAAECALVLVQTAPGELHAVGEANFKAEALDRLLSEAGIEPLVRAVSDSEWCEGPELAAWVASQARVAAVDVLALRGSGEVVGLVLVGHGRRDPERDAFTSYVARTLATQAGLAFERVSSTESLRDASLRDSLTGLGNRRAANEALVALAPGDGVALIDLDHFKRVNDSYGHQAGDRVLRTLGEFLRSSVRSPDQVFRFGGEEFLMILAGSGAAAGAATNRIRRGWSSQRRVTSFSAGVAIHLAGETPEEAVARADAALYEAKRAGRDRVVADPMGADSLPAKPASEAADESEAPRESDAPE